MLIPNLNYRGIIIRLAKGHEFLPFGCVTVDGKIMPTPRMGDDAGFEEFKQKFLRAAALTPQVEAVYIEDLTGNKEELRTRILSLNEQAGLPGIYSPEALAA